MSRTEESASRPTSRRRSFSSSIGAGRDREKGATDWVSSSSSTSWTRTEDAWRSRARLAEEADSVWFFRQGSREREARSSRLADDAEDPDRRRRRGRRQGTRDQPEEGGIPRPQSRPRRRGGRPRHQG